MRKSLQKINRILILFFFVSIAFNSDFYSQQTENSPLNIPDALKSVTPYGTIQNIFSVSKIGFYISDFIPRVGLKGDWKITKTGKYKMFVKTEFGLNLVRRDEYIKFSPDPGYVGKAPQTVFIRQGYIGMSTPYGNISVGRQWGVNYTLSGEIDYMYFGGAYAVGVYNADTDGGISGTGRADQLLKYELTADKFYIGLQGQFRDISDNNKFFADSYGLAAYYKLNNFKIGFSFNKVLDGVEEPDVNQAKINDQLLTFLFDYRTGNFHFGIMPIYFINHEKTDEGVYYSGYGLEYSLRYHFGKEGKWRFVQNSYILKPTENGGEYLLNAFTFNLAYRYTDNTAIVLALKLDNSVNQNGSRRNDNILGVGFYYNFNYFS